MRQTKIFSLHLFRHDVRSNLPLILVVLLIMILMANVVNFAMSLMAAEKIPQEVEDNQEDFFKYLAVMGVYNEKADVEKRQYKVQWKAQKKALSKAEKALGDVDVAVVDAESELDQSAAVLKKRARAMKKATKKQQKAAADMQKKAVAAGIAKVLK